MAGVTFNAAEEFSSLLEEIPSFREKLIDANGAAADFRCANAAYTAALQEFQQPAAAMPDGASARRDAEEQLKGLFEENDARWNAHGAATEFIGLFLNRLELLLQRLQPTPEWQRFANKVRQLRRGIARLTAWHGEMSTDDLDTLEIHLHYGLEQATADLRDRTPPVRATKVNNPNALEKAEDAKESVPCAGLVVNSGQATDLAGGPPRKLRQARRRVEDGLSQVEKRVKQLSAQGLSHFEICDRLGDMPRPPLAKWRHLSWLSAFRNEKYRASVRTKLSKMAHAEISEFPR